MITVNSYFDDVIDSLSEAYLSKKRYKITKNQKKPNNPEGHSWLERLKNHPIQVNGTFDKAACHILSDGLIAEQSLLLHPAIDKPMEHFIFLKDGNVKYGTEKGRQSIKIYGLDRPELIKCRGDMVLTIQERILSEYLENPLPSEKRIKIEVTKILKELTLYKQANKPFTGFVTAILDHFNEFIIDNEDLLGIPLPNQAIMKIAVQEFFEKQSNNS